MVCFVVLGCGLVVLRSAGGDDCAVLLDRFSLRTFGCDVVVL